MLSFRSQFTVLSLFLSALRLRAPCQNPAVHPLRAPLRGLELCAARRDPHAEHVGVPGERPAEAPDRQHGRHGQDARTHKGQGADG